MTGYRSSAADLEYACSGPAGRARWGPGIGHGRELFPYGTSSHTHGYTIDFINPDWHLLGKKIDFEERLALQIMQKTRSKITLKGRIAYLPQRPPLWNYFNETWCTLEKSLKDRMKIYITRSGAADGRIQIQRTENSKVETNNDRIYKDVCRWAWQKMQLLSLHI